MMKGPLTKKLPVLQFASLALVGVLMSCGGGSSSSSTDTTVTSVAVVPSVVSLAINGQQTFTANAVNKEGETVSGLTFRWSSSATDVVTIDPSSGLATAKGPGTAQIVATESSKSVQSSPATLTVLPQVSAVSISPMNAIIRVGDHQQFTATATDVKGSTITGAVITWGISFSGIATIDANGLATGVSSGTVFVTANAGGVTSPIASLNVTN